MKGSGNKLSCLVFVVFVLGGKWATVEILLFGFGVRRWRPAVGLRGVWKELFGRLSLLLTPLDGGGFGGMLTVLIGPEAVWAYVRSSGTSWELDPPLERGLLVWWALACRLWVPRAVREHASGYFRRFQGRKDARCD